VGLRKTPLNLNRTADSSVCLRRKVILKSNNCPEIKSLPKEVIFRFEKIREENHRI